MVNIWRRRMKGATPPAKSNKHDKDFSPEAFACGLHIFCDGCAEPNPGQGGWGVVAYRDGVEAGAWSGGDPVATNNAMELTGLLVAIERANEFAAPATIWCDSQYCVKGVNEWRHGWKAKGWRRGGSNAAPKNRVLMNSGLWRAIDTALGNMGNTHIKVRWVKGHAGIEGNERADQLANRGRVDALKTEDIDLDERFRQAMQE